MNRIPYYLISSVCCNYFPSESAILYCTRHHSVSLTTADIVLHHHHQRQQQQNEVITDVMSKLLFKVNRLNMFYFTFKDFLIDVVIRLFEVGCNLIVTDASVEHINTFQVLPLRQGNQWLQQP